MKLSELRDQRKLGRLAFDMKTMLDLDEDIMRAIMSNIIVLDSQVTLHNNVVTYWAISSIFDPVAEAEEIPLYQVIVGLDNDDKQMIYFKKNIEGDKNNEESIEEKQTK